MRKVLSIALLFAGASLCVVPAVQAHETAQAAWVRVADNDDSSVSTSTSTATSNDNSNDKSNSDGAVEKCIKWIRKTVRVWVKDHYETRTETVCVAVRG